MINTYPKHHRTETAKGTSTSQQAFRVLTEFKEGPPETSVEATPAPEGREVREGRRNTTANAASRAKGAMQARAKRREGVDNWLACLDWPEKTHSADAHPQGSCSNITKGEAMKLCLLAGEFKGARGNNPEVVRTCFT